MPRYIIKLENAYLEWSTVVDAPVTEAMSREDFEADYGEREPEDVCCLDLRMARVEKTGTSSRGGIAVRDLVATNRAGPGESCLSYDELVARFVPEHLRVA